MPAMLTVYYVLALAFYGQVSSREVLRILMDNLKGLFLKDQKPEIATKSAISQARSKLGKEPLIHLYEKIVKPIGTKDAKGVFYKQWRLIAVDGSTLDIADTKENGDYFGYPDGGRGKAAFPQMRMAALSEIGTSILFAVKYGKYTTSEHALFKELIPQLEKGMLLIADRLFYCYESWKSASDTGADLLWRVKKNAKLDVIETLNDGSYLAKIYPSWSDRRRDQNGIIVRVVDYNIEGIEDGEDIYRLITTILDPNEAPAEELAKLYHQRWSIEGIFDEFKNHLREEKLILKSLKPELVIQEFYGLLLAHYSIRGIMYEAAKKASIEPAELSFTHAIRVIRRRMKALSVFSP